ncbi:DUF421 domain-containing protein [Acuticoccus sp. MNP-M23]|uniref:DUF421 domain-containing protein n=1 Tax=Acuticoccus sp. MNP-M23 TaxID=3072793 RepID=UPI0028163512|nr:YetF domain-containing protein [Acuticoccus sp. MNP-M23]WMS44921.1 DUF421 domain-containing protein [Acuticoccus sp. MNP-M23]
MDIFEFNPEALLQIAIAAVVGYAALVAILRISGKRTLTDLNAFDFVVTVALGSILGSTIVSPSVPLANGIAAMLVLILCQYLVAFVVVRSKTVRGVVKAEPTLIVHEGELLQGAMKDQRISEAAVLSAIRNAGNADLADIHAVVVETNGSLSVIGKAPNAKGHAVDASTHPGV